jgi:hypothetical protein
MGSTLLREVNGYSIYFCTYYYCRWKVIDIFSEKIDENQLKNYAVLFAGSMAGLAGWFFVYPFDIIKTRLQMDFLGK